LSSRVPLPDSTRVLKTGRDSDSHPPRPPAGAYRFAPDPIWRNEKNPAIEIRFPLHFFLSAFLDCLEAGAAGAPTLARSHVTLKLRKKGYRKARPKSRCLLRQSKR